MNFVSFSSMNRKTLGKCGYCTKTHPHKALFLNNIFKNAGFPE